MTSYRTTMREALEIMNEDNLEKMRKAAGGAKQTLKMKDGSIGMDSFTASAIMQIYDKINDKNKKTFENMMNNGKKADIVKLMKFAMSKVNASYEEFEEEFDLDEAEAGIKVHAGPDHDRKVKRIQSLAKQLGAKVTNVGKSTDGKMSTIHVKGSMKVVNDLMKLRTEEVDLDEGTKQVLAHGGKGKYKVTKDGDKIEIKFGGKVVGTADFDRGADSFFVSIKGEKGQKSFDDAQAIADYFAKNKITEEVELDEGFINIGGAKVKDDEKSILQHIKKTFPNVKKVRKDPQYGWIPVFEEVELDEAKYDLYHKDFSSAMQHSYKMAKKLYGITVDPKEIDDKVASGPRKPSEGKTNSYRLKGDKGAIQVQVYNKGGSKPFELNMYKEEVELDEGKMSAAQIAKLKKAYEPMRGKKISMASGQKLSSIMDKVDDDKEALSQLVKADIPFVSQLAVTRLITKHGMKGAEIRKMQEEVELDEGTKQVLAHGGKGQYKAVRDGDITKIMYKGKVVGTADFDRGADSFMVSMKGQKGQKSFDDAQAMVDYFAKNKITEGVDEGAAADARRAMRSDPDMKQRAFSKDDSATDDERKAASKNIMMQMRKAVSLRSFDVEFADGKKIKIPQKVAQAVLQKYNSFRKPADKEKYQTKVGKSYKDMLSALKEGFASDAQRRAAFAQGYKAKGKKDKKESTLERMNKKIQEKKNG